MFVYIYFMKKSRLRCIGNGYTTAIYPLKAFIFVLLQTLENDIYLDEDELLVVLKPKI